jgi:hypothetical protein
VEKLPADITDRLDPDPTSNNSGNRIDDKPEDMIKSGDLEGFYTAAQLWREAAVHG